MIVIFSIPRNSDDEGYLMKDDAVGRNGLRPSTSSGLPPEADRHNDRKTSAVPSNAQDLCIDYKL